MSSLSSAKRKLNARSVWIAQEVQRKKLEIAKQFVEEKVKTDAEFAKDVLTAVGENLPPELKKAAEETVARELNKVVNLPKHTAEELLKKWEACETVENVDPKTAVILESQPQPVSEEQLKLIKKWEKTGLLDGIKEGTSSLNTALLIEGQERIPLEKITMDERATENICPPQEPTPTDEELRDFKIVGAPPEEEECCGNKCGCHMRPSDEEMMRPMADDVPLGDGFVATQSDGGGQVIVHETEMPGYQKDG